MVQDRRIPTEIPGLDEVLHGGILRNSSYLLVGAAGTGKTICSVQWLASGARKGERSLLITLAEPEENVRQNLSNFNWGLDELDIVDLSPVDSEIEQSFTEYHVFPPSDVEHGTVWQGIYRAVRDHRPDRVVIDSVTQLRYLSPDDYQFRKQILALVTFLGQQGCTSFLTFETSEYEREASVALAVDGILRLRMEVSPQRVTGLRSIQVEKFRGSDFRSGLHAMRITGEGLCVYPHCIEDPGTAMPGDTMVQTGIAAFDDLLGGGIESGTSTFITGPCGVGKTTLSMQFLAEAGHRGMRGLACTFEESAASIIARCNSLGMDLDSLLEANLLKVTQFNPLELYPDQFLDMLRKAVEHDGRQIVMIDSLRGYEMAMEEFGSITANVHNMVSYLNRKQVTSFLINEVEKITGDLTATEMGVSYIADNVLLLRHAEYTGNVIKVVACLKKRHGSFQAALRQLRITSDGIQVSEDLKGLRGILTGIPTTDKAF